MHQAEVARHAVLRHRAADDELEVAFPVIPVAGVAAVKSRHDAAFQGRQLGPLSLAAVDEAGPLVAQFGFCSFGHPQGMLA